MNRIYKTFALLISLTLFSQSAWAQITITSSHMPKSGDTIRYSQTTAVDLPDLTKTGANHSWDYSTMGMQSQGVYEYKSSLKTPYLLNFGFTAIGQKIADSLGTGQLAIQDVYNFYKKSSSVWETVGIGFKYGSFPLPQAGKHSNTDKIYEFPLKYNNKTSDDFEAKVPITLTIVPVGDFYVKGTRTTEVDGWGKISTPYADKVDCIRVKSVIEEVDSIVIPSLSIDFAIPTKRIEYKWLSTTERIPLLEITGTEVAGNFVPTFIRYRDTFRTRTSRFDITADFKADTAFGTINDTFTLRDLSLGSIINRTWTITPETYTFVNGTNQTSLNPQVKFSQTGRYSVKLVIDNIVNQDSMSKIEYLKVATAGAPKTDLLSSEIYPNPFINTLEIRLDEVKKHTFVKLFDAEGRLVHESEHSNQRIISLSTADFQSGNYLLELRTDNAVLHQKLIKME